MNIIQFVKGAAIAAASFFLISCENTSVQSPDGRISLELEFDEPEAMYYNVKVGGENVLEHSSLGFVLAGGEILGTDMELLGVTRDSRDEVWEQLWGESRYVVNRYNEMKADFRSRESGRLMSLRVRVFDDGFGFRYEFPDQKADSLVIMDETTSFRFAEPQKAWWVSRKDPYYEGYGHYTGFEAVDTAYTPFTIPAAGDRYYAIHEAALLDYAKMNLVPVDSLEVKAMLTPWPDGVKVYAACPFATPWRTMIIADSISELAESKIMYNLNEPSKIEDTSWIKPGKYIGIWWDMHKKNFKWAYGPDHGATTERTKEYIDFAAENGIEAVLVEGWNVGWNGDWMGESWNFSFTRAYPDYDFDEVMQYARDKGVQMIIHNETAANTVHYFTQIDEAYTLYQKHGMHYVKTGNVNEKVDLIHEHDGQYAVNRKHAIVEKAAEYQICIDEHEPVMPTGVSRTWPNLMNHEGVRGQEFCAWDYQGGNKPEHETVVPFIRGLAGPMDFTFGTFNFENSKQPYPVVSRVKTTIAKQLAEYVVIYSPMQMASDSYENYKGVKAFDFIKDVPVDWHESHVPDAVIGDYVVTVRRDRNSEDWYLGAITDENARNLSVSLDFLDGDAGYTAQIYADGPDADWETNPTSVEYSERTVTSKDVLELRLARSGGCAIRFVKL